jgi:Zn-dependent peptidase ImmA (M78 family)
VDSLQRVQALAEHLLDFGDVRRPPAPLSLVHAVADVRLLYVDWLYHQGFAYRRGATYYIAVNSNDPEGEQRFTAFHELFHVIASIQPAFALGAPSAWHGDLLADHFALNVLLSDRWFAASARACGDDPAALAFECGVTPAMVARKLAANQARRGSY